MRASLKVLSVRGINISIHWTFVFLVLWIILINSIYGINIEELGWAILFIVALFACVAMHELGHALMARRFGINAKNIILLPVGGIASIEKFPDNPKQELAISIAGPLVNIVIALLLVPFLQPYTLPWEMQDDVSIVHQHDFLYTLHLANLGLALFNLVPAFPMDGGRILRALLGFKMNYVHATVIAAIVGKVIAALFILLGLFLLSPFLMLIGIFIIVAASTEEDYLRLKALVKGMKIKEAIMYEFNSLQADMTVGEAASLFMNNHARYFVVMHGSRPAGSVNRIDVIRVIAEKQYGRSIRDVMKSEIVCLNGDDLLERVLEKLATSDLQVFPVIVNGEFAGVISFSHLIEYLLIYQAGNEEYSRIRSLAGLLG